MGLPQKSTFFIIPPSILWSISFFAILPFLLLSFYKHPLGTHEWDWISTWAGSMTPLSFVEEQRHWYQTLGGRFTSHAILSTTVFWYTLERFQAFFMLNLLLMYGGIVYLVQKILSNVKKVSIYLIGAIILATYLDNLTNVYESIYRLTVVLIYQFGLMGNMLVAGMLIRLYQTKKQSWLTILLLVILVLLTSGTNELSLALLYINLFVYGLLYFINQRTLPLSFWIASIILLAATAFVFSSPGNQVRIDAIGAHIGFGRAAFLAVAASGYLWLSWLSNSLLLPLSLFMIPTIFLYKKSLMTIPLFNRLWIWLIITLLVVPALLFPLFWSTGGQAFPERVIDFLFMVILFCSMGTLTAFLLRSRLFESFKTNTFPKIIPFVLIGWIFLHLFIGQLSFDRSNTIANRTFINRIEITSNTGRAWRSLLNGDAKQYSKEMHHQYDQVSTCQTSVCTVTRPSILPFPLYDNIYDRKDKNGDPFMGWAINGRKQIVIYRDIKLK